MAWGLLMGREFDLFPPGGILEKIREPSLKNWCSYVDHSFVKQLGRGVLAEECFRHYLVQDYLFLVHFARAYALSAYKSEKLSDIRKYISTCQTILETEMQLHVEFSKDWGLTESDLESASEDTATLAYTRYVLECGFAGDILDLQIALAPCLIGYGEIGLALSGGAISDNPFRSWIEMYSGREYQDAARETIENIEVLAVARGAIDRLDSLRLIFNQALRLEIAFWDQALAVARN